MWGGCIAAILAEDRPTIKAINPTTWINSTNYRELEFQPSLDAFTAQHAALQTGAGKPLERTVIFYAQWLAHHERPHIKQIARIVNALPR